MVNYLTEKSLGSILTKLNLEFVHNKSVPGSIRSRMRADYRIESLKLVIEFDGDTHYRNSNRIIMDEIKDQDYVAIGYRVLRIPYFIQPCSELISDILNKPTDWEQIYPHGFISSTCILPADFCELGIYKFKHDLIRFPWASETILQSLKNRIATVYESRIIIPNSLLHLL